jgi:hypothetical protein
LLCAWQRPGKTPAGCRRYRWPTGFGLRSQKKNSTQSSRSLRGGAETKPREFSLGEEGLEDLGAVVEDAADVGGDEEAVDQGAAEDGVVNVVGDLGAVVLGDEAMFVAPEAIGAAELFVDEAVRRIPGGDFAFPRDG